MTRKLKYKNFLNVFITLFLFVVIIIGRRGLVPAFAYTLSYTNVLTDLQKDSTFKMSDYPDNSKDYSINVIQIAESESDNLFLYTYQPCQKTTYLLATQINMSLSDKLGKSLSNNISARDISGAIGGVIGGVGGSIENNPDLPDNDKPKLYSLTLVSADGVFCKYKVDNFTVSNENVRYYNITSIYRVWDKTLDGEPSNDNVKLEKFFEVGKLFTAETVDGSVKYSCKNVNVVEILNPYVDFISYGQQSGWDYIFGVTKWTDIHYIAFSTDKKIDTLKEADVTYTVQSYHFSGIDGYSYGEKSGSQYKTLTGKEEIGINGYEKYTWNSIYRTEDFIKTTELTGMAKAEVEKSQFVLVFLKTSFDEQEEYSFMQGHYKVADGTKVSDVAILRLMFEADGITYNLGVLMDKQEGDDIAGNKPENESIGFWAYIWRCIVRLFNGTATLTEQIVAIVVLAICVLALPILLTVLSLCIPAFGEVMKTIFKGLWIGIKYLFIGLWYVISAPFRFMAWIADKCWGE